MNTLNSAASSDASSAEELETGRLKHFLSIPYVAVFSSDVNERGEWVRQADYPELPKCSVEAASAVEAMENLEVQRVAVIVDLLARGQEPPAPDRRS